MDAGIVCCVVDCRVERSVIPDSRSDERPILDNEENTDRLRRRMGRWGWGAEIGASWWGAATSGELPS